MCLGTVCMSWAKLNRFKLGVESRHMKNIEIYCAEASTLYRSDSSLSLCNNVLRMIVLRRHRRESTQKERRQFRSLNLCSELFYICARSAHCNCSINSTMQEWFFLAHIAIGNCRRRRQRLSNFALRLPLKMSLSRLSNNNNNFSQ